MRFLLLLTLAPVLWSRPINLYFQDVETYYGGAHELGDFYDNPNLGGDYGIHSSDNPYTQPFVTYGALHFPLHGPGVIYVEPGIHNFLTFQYNGYLPFAPEAASIVLRYQGVVVQHFTLPNSGPNDFRTETITVDGVADEIWFGVNPDGTFAGNAGDVTYREIDVDEVDPQPVAPIAPPAPIQSPTPTEPLRVLPTSVVTSSGAPALDKVVAAPTVRSQARTQRLQSVRRQSPVRSIRGR